MTTQECRVCHKIKSLTDFLGKSSSLTGYDTKCKDCFNNYQKQYRKKKNNALEYYYRNKDKCKQKTNNYSKNNRDIRNEIQRNWRKKQRETNPSYKIWQNARKRIWKVLHVKKPTTTDKLIGTSPIMFKLWLSFTFSDKMNWDNYGSYWHIEHVIPIATYDLNDEKNIYKAFHWTNCRAETEEYNLGKQDIIDHVQVEKHKRDLEYFQKIIEFKKSLKLEIRSQASSREVEGSTTRQSNLNQIKVI